jgi:hypothetical protein
LQVRGEQSLLNLVLTPPVLATPGPLSPIAPPLRGRLEIDFA